MIYVMFLCTSGLLKTKLTLIYIQLYKLIVSFLNVAVLVLWFCIILIGYKARITSYVIMWEKHCIYRLCLYL